MSANHERRKIRVEGEWLGEHISAENLIAQVQEMCTRYGASLEFEYDYPAYLDDGKRLIAFYERDETDFEMQKRIKAEKEREGRDKARRQQEYLRLKAEFGE